jgi:prepilin-type N-terminal cleavage/methylation domain-containing protein
VRPRPRRDGIAVPGDAARGRAVRGFSVLELAVVVALLGVLLTLAVGQWRHYVALQRLRYGVAQVATGLRQAQERARAERMPYTVTFTAGSRLYPIARSGGGFREDAELPEGITPTASRTVTFDAFGRPDAAHTITLQNPQGIVATATVNAGGGISYQEP